MGTYRVCRAFTVESGHMLSKHPEKCRFPHGHTRRIEVVCSAEKLNKFDMVIDFKAMKLALTEFIEMFDHSMALNSKDPLLASLQKHSPDGIIVYDDQDPTTEVIAADVFAFVEEIFAKGWQGKSDSGTEYRIPAGRITLERVRVSETADSWAEYSR